MSKLETAFQAAIADSERRILIQKLSSSPDLTLGEILSLSKGELGHLFTSISISALLSGDSSGPARAPGVEKGSVGRSAGGGEPAKAGRQIKRQSPGPAVKAGRGATPAVERKGPTKGARRTQVINTRDIEGRVAYDEALFKAIESSGGPIGAATLIAKIGGTGLQARAGLARLIEAGRISWTGRTRGTKYSVAPAG
jgi:hypothetical protein